MIHAIPGITAEPRDYQNRLVEKALQYLDDKQIRSVLIQSPCGSGKTLLGLAIARLLQDKYGIGVGWVAMRRHLLAQAIHENTKHGTNVQGMQVISMFEKDIPTKDTNGEKIELLIGDEAHHDATSSMANIHNHIKSKWILGLSASPYRTDKIKLAFSKVIRDIGIHQLIQNGYLSPYHHYTIPEWTVQSVVDTFLREPNKWGKSAIYFHRRSEAIECCEKLIAAGINAQTIFGDTAGRERILKDFRTGDTQVLVNMFILTEGFDFSGLKTCFVRDSIKLPSIQMAGRAFRKHKDHPYKQVVQSKNTKYPFIREATPAESYVWQENSWRSYKKSPQIEQVSARMVLALAKIETRLPERILKFQKRQNIDFGIIHHD